jgi:hypothetical protein
MRGLLIIAIFPAQGGTGLRTANGIVSGKIRSLDSSPAAEVRVITLAVPDAGGDSHDRLCT